VAGQERAPVHPGRVGLATAPALGFADDSLADLSEHVVAKMHRMKRVRDQDRGWPGDYDLRPPALRRSRTRPIPE
jgi:hypothetical protein